MRDHVSENRVANDPFTSDINLCSTNAHTYLHMYLHTYVPILHPNHTHTHVKMPLQFEGNHGITYIISKN